MAIAGLITSATAGSVYMQNSGEYCAKQNGSFHDPQTNVRLGIGQGTWTSRLHTLFNQNSVTRRMQMAFY